MKRFALLLLLLAAPVRAGDLTITTNGTKVKGGTYGSLYLHANDVKIEGAKFDGPFLKVNTHGVAGGSARDTLIDCTFTGLGKGVTDGEIVMINDVDGMVETRVRKFITVEPGASTSGIRPYWHYDDRNRVQTDCYTALSNGNGYSMPVRWRADNAASVPLKNGCFNNQITRDTLIITGKGPMRVVMSSSATCDGTNAGCIGAWDWTLDHCIFDGAAVSGGAWLEWQGGMVGLTMRNTSVRMNGNAIYGFQIQRDIINDCLLQNTNAGGVAVRLTDEYGRPLGKAGDLTFCRNNVIGTFSAASTLQPMVAAMGLNCGAPPPPPPPPVTSDTARVQIAVPSLPAVITIIKK